MSLQREVSCRSLILILGFLVNVPVDNSYLSKTGFVCWMAIFHVAWLAWVRAWITARVKSSDNYRLENSCFGLFSDAISKSARYVTKTDIEFPAIVTSNGPRCLNCK